MEEEHSLLTGSYTMEEEHSLLTGSYTWQEGHSLLNGSYTLQEEHSLLTFIHPAGRTISMYSAMAIYEKKSFWTSVRNFLPKAWFKRCSQTAIIKVFRVQSQVKHSCRVCEPVRSECSSCRGVWDDGTHWPVYQTVWVNFLHCSYQIG